MYGRDYCMVETTGKYSAVDIVDALVQIGEGMPDMTENFVANNSTQWMHFVQVDEHRPDLFVATNLDSMYYVLSKSS